MHIQKHHVISYLHIKRKIHNIGAYLTSRLGFNSRPLKPNLLAMRDKRTTRSFRQATHLISTTTVSWTRGGTLHGRLYKVQTRIVETHIAYEIKYKHKHYDNSPINIYMAVV